jgi:nucleoside-diphosphate-sugar epimerase
MKTSLKYWFAKQILSTTSRHRSEFQLIIERPTETIINNIMDTEIVLANACHYRKPQLLITSTSEVYGKSEQRTFREDADRIT